MPPPVVDVGGMKPVVLPPVVLPPLVALPPVVVVAMQLPPIQVSPVAQALLQAPQWSALISRLTQDSPHPV
jgi:hypothetical protein